MLLGRNASRECDCVATIGARVRHGRRRLEPTHAYSVKPLDTATLSAAARETGGMIVVEDHAIDGGLGDAVAATVGGIAPVHRLGISELPHSGTSEQLLDRYRISRRAIEENVLRFAV
jgi:transketolase